MPLNEVTEMTARDTGVSNHSNRGLPLLLPNLKNLKKLTICINLSDAENASSLKEEEVILNCLKELPLLAELRI